MHEDQKVWGEFFGLPRTHGPDTWAAFQNYFNTMLHGPLLGSEPVCAEVAQRVVYMERPNLLRLATSPLRFLVTERIPQPLLKRLGVALAVALVGEAATDAEPFREIYASLTACGCPIAATAINLKGRTSPT